MSRSSFFGGAALALAFFAAAGSAMAQRPTPTDNDQIVEEAVVPVDRPNQIAVRELAARLGMELRAAADGKVVVGAVFPRSQAAALDIRAGDVLISLERQAITSEVAAVNIIAADNPEKKISLVFQRDGKPIALSTAFPDRVSRVAPLPSPAVPPRTPRASLFGVTAVENSGGQVVVTAVEAGSAAETAGLSRDDVLLRVDDADVTSLERFAVAAGTASKAKSPGDKLTIDALRKGSDQTFVLILRETDFVATPPVVVPTEPVPLVSPVPAPVATLTDQVIFCMQLRRLASGSIVVADVKPGSPAALAGIQAGDAIVSIAKEKIDSLAELADTIASQREGEVVEFGVVRADKLGTIQVKMLPCEYRPALAELAPGHPGDAPTVEELAARVETLQGQIDELAQTVKSLTVAVRGLQKP